MRVRSAVVLMAAVSTFAAAASCSKPASCAGVAVAGTVSVDLTAFHKQHPGQLTVKMCVDGTCSSSQLAATQDVWSDTADSAKTRDIKVTITDSDGNQLFTDGALATPTKVVFNPGQCDEQTVNNSALVAGADGTLTSVAVTATVVHGP